MLRFWKGAYNLDYLDIAVLKPITNDMLLRQDPMQGSLKRVPHSTSS